MPKKQNAPWTEDDDLRLLEMRAAGRSIPSVAAALKRSARAVTGRIAVLRSRAKAEAKAGPLCPKTMLVSAQHEGLA